MKKDITAPIGIFDSGIGGLTVASAIKNLLPKESFIYFGDTAHLPYGEKSIASIQEYALEIADFLVSKGCKMIVIACNTASAAAYEVLKKKYQQDIPVIDVISPLVDFIVKKDFKKIGVLATKATVRSDVYSKKIAEQNENIEVVSLASGLLASMIEEGFFNNEISNVVLHKYLTYPDFEDIDALLLACTHYPLIKNEIEQFYDRKVKVFDSVDEVAKKVQLELNRYGLLNVSSIQPKDLFFVSDYTLSFEQTTKIFYKQQVQLEIAKF